MTRIGKAVLVLALILASCARPQDTAPAAIGESMTAFVTGYTYYDNTPARSGTVSHPQIHRTAGGRGTHADPITLAVGHSKATGHSVLDFPAGTRFYLPHVERYFIVEDTCGDGPRPETIACHTGFEAPATAWVDIWVDGRGLGRAKADACARSITGIHEIIRNPGPDREVTLGSVCN